MTRIGLAMVEAVAYAQKWLAAGRDRAAVAKAIWNKFGYAVDTRHGRFNIGDSFNPFAVL